MRSILLKGVAGELVLEMAVTDQEVVVRRRIDLSQERKKSTKMMRM